MLNRHSILGFSQITHPQGHWLKFQELEQRVQRDQGWDHADYTALLAVLDKRVQMSSRIRDGRHGDQAQLRPLPQPIPVPRHRALTKAVVAEKHRWINMVSDQDGDSYFCH